MKIRIFAEVEVHDVGKLIDYVYNVQHADENNEDIDSIVDAENADDMVPKMVLEALLAGGDVAPLEMGVEIMTSGAESLETPKQQG